MIPPHTASAPRVGIFGRGRLGSAIAAAAGPSLAWQVTRELPPPEVPVDVLIEASAAAAVPQRLEYALERELPLVVGTTGWEIPELEARVAQRIGLLVAPNFSLTVALLRRLALVLARFAARQPDFDPYLVEHHHARKHDAPSGTARLLAKALLEGCPRKTEWALGGPLAPHQLSLGVLRAGATYSTHRIGLDSSGEWLELEHSARSAQPFAQGALLAASWIRGRRGLFSMEAVASEVLDPVFEFTKEGAAR